MTQPPNHIDTHCHLTLCDVSPAEHIARAREQGIKWILDPGIWVTDFLERYRLLHPFPEVLFGLACAPHSRRDNRDEEDIESLIQVMEETIDNYPIAALSEIGLDYHHLIRGKENQHELFEKQLALARRRNLPVFLHIRDAYEDAYDLVVKSGHRRGAVHCFTSNVEDAFRFIDWGFYISFSGIVTFKKSEPMREVVKRLPEDKILTETDSPFLSPSPFRGKSNQAGNIIYVNRCIAEVKNWSEEKCHQQLRKNAQRLIGFDRGADEINS